MSKIREYLEYKRVALRFFKDQEKIIESIKKSTEQLKYKQYWTELLIIGHKE